jgi:hypothetical protein
MAGLSSLYTFNEGVHDVIEENLVELYNLGGLFLLYFGLIFLGVVLILP